MDPLTSTSDTQLVAWLLAGRRGDETAANELCRELSRRLRAFFEARLSARGKRWVDPEDLTQQVLPEVLRAFDRLGADPLSEELRVRLYRIARTRMLDGIRNARHLAGESQVASWHGGQGLSTGPVTRADTQHFVRETIARLPEPYAEILRLCALDELSFVDAGEQLSLSADAVRKRYHRAREVLASHLQGVHRDG